MNETDQPTPTPSENKDSLKPYSKPEISEYGAIQEITQGASGAGFDGSTGGVSWTG